MRDANRGNLQIVRADDFSLRFQIVPDGGVLPGGSVIERQGNVAREYFREPRQPQTS